MLEVTKARLHIAKNQAEIDGNAMKAMVHNSSNKSPFSHWPRRGLMICWW
ncbi:MAG: hypothetical protein ACOYEA_06800 [Fermentimonas sp.]